MEKGIPHIIQDGSWDCGLACLRMAVKYLNPKLTEEDIDGACKRHNLGKSVWTIDLAYLCKILGIRHYFCTQTLGVDKNYEDESFYRDEMQSDFSEEEIRVNNLFAKASEKGVNVEKRFVELQEIIDHIQTEQPAIILINDSQMHQNPQRDDNLSGDLFCNIFQCCYPRTSNYDDIEGGEIDENARYWGHFVTIVGVNVERRFFVINDPSPGGEHVHCSFEVLERARKSFGTDEDILFMFKSPS